MPRMWICITVRFPCNQELAFSESQLKAIIGNVHVISSLNYRIIVTSKCNSQRVNCSRFYPFKYPKAGNWKITQTINKTFMLIFMETAGQNTLCSRLDWCYLHVYTWRMYTLDSTFLGDFTEVNWPCIVFRLIGTKWQNSVIPRPISWNISEVPYPRHFRSLVTGWLCCIDGHYMYTYWSGLMYLYMHLCITWQCTL